MRYVKDVPGIEGQTGPLVPAVVLQPGTMATQRLPILVGEAFMPILSTSRTSATMDDRSLSRRRLLGCISATGLTGLAGCNDQPNDSTGSRTTTTTSGPTTATETLTTTDAPLDLSYNELRYPAKIIEGEPFHIGVEVYNEGENTVDTSVTLAVGDHSTSKTITLDSYDAVRVRFHIDTPLSPATYPITLRTPAAEPVTKGTVRVAERASLLHEFVGVAGAEFELDGESFSFNGGNSDMLSRAPRWYVDRVFEGADELGFRALRNWVYAGRCHIGSCAGEGLSIVPQPDDLNGPIETLPPLNEVVLKRLDYAIYKANETGVRLVLPFLGNTGSGGFGSTDFVNYSATATDHDDFYTDETCRKLFKEYVTAILTRENTITGREYRDDPGILMWELVNEPDLLDNDGSTAIMQDWIEEMAPFVKSVDDNHLLSTGEIGYYEDTRPQSLADKNDQGMAYLANHQPEAIDAATFHMYLNQNNFSRVEDGVPRWKTWVENHARDAHETLEKPVYAGEFAPGNGEGAYLVDRRDPDWRDQDRRRAEKYREIFDVFTDAGVNGALNWTFMIPLDFATDPVTDPDQWNSSTSVYLDDPYTPGVLQTYSATLGRNK